MNPSVQMVSSGIRTGNCLALRKPQMTNKERKPKSGFNPSWNLLEELSHESDRGCVLIAGDLLDRRLKLAILRHFERASEDVPASVPEKHTPTAITKRLMGFDRPLGTFGVRIQMCRAVGIIPYGFYRWLLAFKDIRNGFAHTPYPTALEDDDINRLMTWVPFLVERDDLRLLTDGEDMWQQYLNRSDCRAFSTPRLEFMVIAVLANMFAHLCAAPPDVARRLGAHSWWGEHPQYGVGNPIN